MTTRRLLPPALILVMLAVGVLVAPDLPQRTPVHWDLAGEPDGWGGPWLAALGLPVTALAVWAFVAGMTRLAGRVRDVEAARPAIDRLQLYMVLVWIALYASTLAPHLGYSPPLDPTGVGLLALGLFFVATGVTFRRAEARGEAGALVNLPTDDPEVKRDVLRAGGRLLAVAGVVMAPAGLLGPRIRLWALVLSLGLPALGLPAYVVARLLRARG